MLEEEKIVLVTFRAKESDKVIIREILKDLAIVKFIDELSQEELDRILPKTNIILTGSGLDLTREILEKTRNLEMIQTLSAGVDTVPIRWIPKKAILCSNAGGNAPAVAEHALALLLAAAKKVVFHDRAMRRGVWLRRDQGVLLRGKTLGIIGFGNIGKTLAKLAKCLGMRIYAINRSGKTDMPIDFIGTINELPKVLRESDFVVIALPLTKKTKHLITKRELELMKKDAVLINIARGEIIRERDLYYHLKENPEFVACLDVWWKYPGGSEETYQDYPFHELPNVIMTPHIAGFSKELRREVIQSAVENIRRFLEGKKPKNIVNIEEYLDL